MNIGVVGTGRLGSLHARMLSSLETVRLAGIHDADTEKARALGGELGVPVFSTLGELLDCTEALTIATDTTSHAEVARAALGRGKHVFIEKPLAGTVAEAEEICSLARAGGLILQVGHIERFNPAILALEGRNLRPLFVESHRLSMFNPRGTDVAVVLDLMIHDIDIILSLVKAPVTRVDASGVAVVSDTVDIANARLQFAGGCVANVTASRISQKKMRKMRLFQKEEYISVDFLAPSAEVFRLCGAEEEPPPGALALGAIGSGTAARKVLYERPVVREVNALRHELALFVQSVREGTPPVVSGEDGLRALEVAHAIMEKIARQEIGSP
ncbi:MAG: Gfo/Idh/MocA family oxidoreductase [Bacteroidota bacterium]